MNPDALILAFRKAGLDVQAADGWRTRGYDWTSITNKPIGLMEHHTAQPVPFPIRMLTGEGDGRIKCNTNVKPDGTLWVVSFGACNYSSGKGSSIVWREVLAGQPPAGNARSRDLNDNMGGNRWFWNCEVDHLGDGSPQTLAAKRTTVIATHVAAQFFGLSHLNVISHAEWSRRKIDPWWDGPGLRTAIEDIRRDVAILERDEDKMYVLTRDTAKNIGDGSRASDVAFHAGLLRTAFDVTKAVCPSDGTWPLSMSSLIQIELGGNGDYITGNMGSLLHDRASAAVAAGMPTTTLTREEWEQHRSEVAAELRQLADVVAP